MIEIVQIMSYVLSALFIACLVFAAWVTWMHKDEEEEKQLVANNVENSADKDSPALDDFDVGGFHLDVPFPRIYELGFVIRICKIYDEYLGSCTWRVLALRGDDLLFFDSCDKRTITDEEKSRLETLVITRQNFVCEFEDDPRNVLGAPILASMIYLFWLQADYYNSMRLWDEWQPHVIELRTKQ